MNLNEKIDWNAISCIDSLPDEFVLEYRLYLNFEYVFQSTDLKEETLNKLAPLFTEKEWFYLWDEQKVSEQFIENHLDKVDWERICYMSNLSEDFIRKHIKKIDWEAICVGQNLSESFLREYWDKVYWYDVLMFHDNLTSEFVREIVQFASKNYKGQEPLIQNISSNTKIDKKIFNEYVDQLNWCIIGNENSLTEEEIIKWNEKLYWTDILGNQHVSFPFLKKFIRTIKSNNKWRHVFAYNELPEDFIENFVSKKTHANTKWLWSYIWQYQLPSEQFIRKHINKIRKNDWYYITHNPNISIQFFKDFKDKIDWRNFSCTLRNEQFIRELIEACSEKINWEKLDYSEASFDFVHTYWNKLNFKNKWYCWSYVKDKLNFKGDRIVNYDE